MLFAVFVLGLVLTVAGWLFDRALELRWFASLVVPNYVHATAILDGLETDARRAFVAPHDGFEALVQRWPGLESQRPVTMIRRSIAFLQFGPTVSPEIELNAEEKDGREVPPRWRISAARKQLTLEANNRLSRMGAVVFFLGVLISAVTGIGEFL